MSNSLSLGVYAKQLESSVSRRWLAGFAKDLAKANELTPSIQLETHIRGRSV